MTSAKRLFSGINITCIRGGRILFQKLSFGLNSGDVVHLSGPNGAGKTSLLRIMCGALPAADGEITWNGKDFLENGLPEHAERFAFLPSDDRSLKPLETVYENLRFWAGIWSVDEENCLSALERMHILNLKDTPVRYLSAGQKRRLSLARVFLKKAPLWLLDEPLNALDEPAQQAFRSVLATHLTAGGLAIVATHAELGMPGARRLELQP